MRPSEEEELVLRLTLEHLKETGGWPKLEDLHQRIHQELQVKVDVKETARRLYRQPFVGGGYSNLGETFAPPLEVIVQANEGRQLLRHVVNLIALARDKYEVSRGQPEITSDEFMDACGVEDTTARAVRELVHQVPGVTDGGTSNANGWSFTVHHEVTQWDGLLNDEDLLSRLREMRLKDQEHLGKLTEAKQSMSRYDARRPPSRSEDSSDETKTLVRVARYLEAHPVRRILTVVGIPLGIAVAIVTLIKA